MAELKKETQSNESENADSFIGIIINGKLYNDMSRDSIMNLQ